MINEGLTITPGRHHAWIDHYPVGTRLFLKRVRKPHIPAGGCHPACMPKKEAFIVNDPKDFAGLAQYVDDHVKYTIDDSVIKGDSIGRLVELNGIPMDEIMNAKLPLWQRFINWIKSIFKHGK